MSKRKRPVWPARKENEEEKRRPLLVDVFAHAKHFSNETYHDILLPKLIPTLQAKAMQARRFVLDDEASMRVGDVIRDVPDLLVRESQFARAPFPLTWIEISSSVMWHAIYRDRPDKQSLAAPDHAARIGILIDDNRVYMVAGGTAEEPDNLSILHVCPYSYEMNTDLLDGVGYDVMRHMGIDPENDDRFMRFARVLFWGSTCDDVPAGRLDEITRHFCYFPLFDPHRLRALDPKDYRQRLENLTAECIGDLRNIVAVLLMMNRPAITRYGNEVARGRGWIKNKNVPFMSHTTVHINLDPIPVLRMVGTPAGEGIERRRHEVRGHYCHNQTARDYSRIAGCVHEWISTYDDWTPVGDNYPPADVNHWVCSVCEGKRWWRDAHERGTAEVGFTAHDAYEVHP